MRIQNGLAIFIAVCSTMTCSNVAATEVVPPTFSVESTQLDVGPVTAGKTAAATFVFHNDSDREVRILRAAPS
jgi:hypothetical protein